MKSEQPRKKRTFRFVDLDGDCHVTDRWIIRKYFPYWCKRMRKVNKGHLISAENCIEDFCVVHWAEETTPR